MQLLVLSDSRVTEGWLLSFFSAVFYNLPCSLACFPLLTAGSLVCGWNHCSLYYIRALLIPINLSQLSCVCWTRQFVVLALLLT